MATKAYVGAPGGIKAGTTTDYVDIEYYLDPTKQTKIEIKCTFDDITDINAIIGTHYYNYRREANFSFFHNTEGKIMGVWFGYPFETEKIVQTNRLYTFVFNLINGSQTISIDGKQEGTAAYTGLIKNTTPFYLFTRNANSKIANIGTWIQSCKIWENNVLVRSLDPYMSNNAKGFYDSVIDKFYQMSPSSILLQENIAREIKNMYVGVQDYVESNGTEVLPTTIISKVNQKAVLTMSFDEIPSDTNGFFFGNNFNGTFHAGIGVSNGKWCYTVGTATDARTVCASNISPEINKKYLVEMYWGGTSQYLKINGLLVRESSETAWTEVGGNKLRLFGYNNNPNLKVKIYGCAIYQNNTLVADYIPKGKTFYDNISKTILPEIDTLKKGLDVAKRIFRGYVGVDNVARLCWDNSGFYSTAIENAFPDSRLESTILSNGNHLLVAGGKISNAVTDLVEAYDTSFVYSTPTKLGSKKTRMAGAVVGDYLVFAGGINAAESSAVATVYAYKTSTLARTTQTSLSQGKYFLSGASVGNYAIFAGGMSTSSLSKTANAYSKTLTRTTPTSLSLARINMGSASNANYAIFAGGATSEGTDLTDTVDAYNTTLTHSVFPNLTSLGDSNCENPISSNDYAQLLNLDRWNIYNTSGIRYNIPGLDRRKNRVLRKGSGVYFKNHYLVPVTSIIATFNSNFIRDGRVHQEKYEYLNILGDYAVGISIASNTTAMGKIQYKGVN